jgi:hypothetical protein
MVAGQIPIAASATSVTSSVATLAASFMPAHTGDVTSSAGGTVNTLATVNSNVGTFQGLTVNAKGLVTAAANQSYLTSSGVSGLTAGQLTVAASATTITSSIANGQLPATATNDNAAAGKVGEVISTVVTAGVALPTTVVTTIATLALTAGDWDVQGEVWIASNNATFVQAGIHSVAATIVGVPTLGLAAAYIQNSAATMGEMVIPLSPCRVSLASPTNMFLNAGQTGGSGATGSGKIWARRAR